MSAHAPIWRAALGRGSQSGDQIWISGYRSESGGFPGSRWLTLGLERPFP